MATWKLEEMLDTADWRYMSEVGELESDLRSVLCRMMGLLSPYASDEDRLMAAKGTVAVSDAADQVHVWYEASREHAFRLFRPLREGQAQPSPERKG